MLDSQEMIAAAILSAPGWVRLGITAPDARMRVQAAETMAAHLREYVGEPLSVQDRNQLPLPL
ncbi:MULTISPECIES: DUF6771 family protein [Sphingomonas]|uniref:Uncharacterized protein n=1 Tax=Sphingomonas hankookensis TaxID=563996 RepID=A0ABR5Y922_9SPHN|nr:MULTISPECIES: DUF6771 family protein [Sphingomonas]KZE11099.1 hypothetical protein AVT10_17385 [Sphingomonas hankookensis]RSV17610.1 hypothetical protein CA237_19050 [Sphingomonas sp. ABOLH]